MFFSFSKICWKAWKIFKNGKSFLSHNRKSFRLFNTRNCDLRQIVVDVKFSRKKVRFWKVTQHSVVRRDVHRMKDECLWVFLKHLKIHTQNCPHNLDFCLQGVKILRFITLDIENFFFHKMETEIKSLKRGFIFFVKFIQLFVCYFYRTVVAVGKSNLTCFTIISDSCVLSKYFHPFSTDKSQFSTVTDNQIFNPFRPFQ